MSRTALRTAKPRTAKPRTAKPRTALRTMKITKSTRKSGSAVVEVTSMYHFTSSGPITLASTEDIERFDAYAAEQERQMQIREEIEMLRRAEAIESETRDRWEQSQIQQFRTENFEEYSRRLAIAEDIRNIYEEVRLINESDDANDSTRDLMERAWSRYYTARCDIDRWVRMGALGLSQDQN